MHGLKRKEGGALRYLTIPNGQITGKNHQYAGEKIPAAIALRSGPCRKEGELLLIEGVVGQTGLDELKL